MDEYARPDYINNVYSYYGVSPGPRTPVAASNGAKAGTDVTGTAGATASREKSLRRLQVEPARRTKNLQRLRTLLLRRIPMGLQTRNPSAKAIRSAKAINTRPSIGRGETASPVTTEKFPLESTTSSNENKKSRRQVIEDTSAHQTKHDPRIGRRARLTYIRFGFGTSRPLLATD